MLRAVAIYALLIVVFRITGKRTLAEISSFDLILLLIISEAAQNAMIGEDYSFTNAAIVIVTLVTLDVALSLVKERSKRLEKWLDDVPLVIVEDGRPLEDRMKRSRVDEGDVMEAARELQGLERMDQIRLAVLERNGRITIVPKR